MKTFKNVLAAIDLSSGDRLLYPKLTEDAQEALDKALFIAKCSKGKTTLQCILDIEPGLPEFTKRTHDIRPTLEKEALEILSEHAEPFEKEGLEVKKSVAFGKPHIEIIRKIIRDDHDLLVCGTRKNTYRRFTSLGSTSIKLVRKAPCPVLVAKPTAEKNYKCVLASVDLTPVSEKVALLAREVVDLYGADLHFIHVVEYPELGAIYRDEEKEADEYRERVKERSREKMKELAEEYTPNNATKHIILKEGVPSHQILDTVEGMKPDMVVMATLSRTGIEGFITGNTAEKVMIELASSLLVVKPDGFVCPIK